LLCIPPFYRPKSRQSLAFWWRLLHNTGIFYVPGMMPDWARDALVWNPLVHAIDWFRAGFYAAYQPHWLDRSYLLILAILLLLAGLAVERGLRRRLSEPL
jgi:capsular polysaccharide transport system permease protein